MKQQIVLNTNLGNTQAKAPKMTNKYQQLYNNYNHNEKTQSSSVKHCSGAFSGWGQWQSKPRNVQYYI